MTVTNHAVYRAIERVLCVPLPKFPHGMSDADRLAAIQGAGLADVEEVRSALVPIRDAILRSGCSWVVHRGMSYRVDRGTGALVTIVNPRNRKGRSCASQKEAAE